MSAVPRIWFPTVRTGTGTDVFTERLAKELRAQGYRADISWLPLRAEYLPWTVPPPRVPAWATVAHTNTWLNPRFLPADLPVISTLHHAVHHPDAKAYKGRARAIYHRHWICPNERRVMRRSDVIVAVSQFVADSARMTLLNLPMRVIYNGVNTDLYCPPRSKTGPSKPFRLLYVGSWMARKGVDLLPHIMQLLGDDFILNYTGGDNARHDKASFPPNMRDIGRLNGDIAIVAAMQQADALLLPSRSEGHPLVAIEAMACGLPIIGAGGSSVDEVIVHNHTGLLCRRDATEDFAQAARFMANHPSATLRMGEAARNLAVARFSSRSMVSDYLEIYCASRSGSDHLRTVGSRT